MVTVCDSKLFGRTLEEGEFSLEIEEDFYGGEEASVEECLKALKRATIANLVGSIVDHAVEDGFIDPKCVLEIEEVPHAQMMRI